MNPGIDFRLSATRDKQAARHFCRRALGRANTRNPRTVITDRLKSYPGALRDLTHKGELGRVTRHRRGRWLTDVFDKPFFAGPCNSHPAGAAAWPRAGSEERGPALSP